MISIGELARQSGVKVPTIRYYEQMGLIAAPARSDGNQRRYSRVEADRLGFIKHVRDLGFSIEVIRELLRLRSHPSEPCADADRIAEQHLAAVREKIAKLRRMESELERMATGCEASRVEDCYVLQSLADHRLCAKAH